MRWVAFPLHPETPPEGLPLVELFGGDEEKIRGANDRMKDLMAEEGLPWSPRTRTWNSRLAQELAKWAETRPGGDAIHDALFKAYFADGENISDRDVLVGVARSIGLDEKEAAESLEERRFADAVDEDWRLSAEYGITGVPTFVAGNRAVVGAQSYEILEHLVQIASAD